MEKSLDYMKVIGSKIVILIALCLLSVDADCQQSRAQLESDRMALIRQIESTEQMLSNALSNKESTLSKINALELQIDARSALIANLIKESELDPNSLVPAPIESIEKVAVDNNATPDSISYLIEDYKKLLQIHYRNKLLNKDLGLITGKDNLKSYITKWRYLETYHDLLLEKGDDIDELTAVDAQPQTVAQVNSPSSAPSSSIAEMITNEKEQKKLLEQEMARLMTIASSMSSDERTIKQQLDRQYQERESYNKSIENILLNSLGSTASPTTNQGVTLIRTTLPVSNIGIEQKRGFLAWPIGNYTITRRYGLQPHPTITDITINNKGVDLTTRETQVSSIFDGQVINISNVSNNNLTIIIKHDGDYYSVYSGLRNTSISLNDYVSTNQNIGTLAQSSSGTGQLHFELYQGKKDLNPKHWLKNN